MLRLTSEQAQNYHAAWAVIPETGRKLEALRALRDEVLCMAMQQPQVNEVGRQQALEFLVRAKAIDESLKLLSKPVVN